MICFVKCGLPRCATGRTESHTKCPSLDQREVRDNGVQGIARQPIFELHVSIPKIGVSQVGSDRTHKISLQLWAAGEQVTQRLNNILDVGNDLVNTHTRARTHARKHERTHTRTHALTHARTHTHTSEYEASTSIVVQRAQHDVDTGSPTALVGENVWTNIGSHRLARSRINSPPTTSDKSPLRASVLWTSNVDRQCYHTPPRSSW